MRGHSLRLYRCWTNCFESPTKSGVRKKIDLETGGQKASARLFRAKLTCSFNDLKGWGGLRKYLTGCKRDIDLGWSSQVWRICFGEVFRDAHRPFNDYLKFSTLAVSLLTTSGTVFAVARRSLRRLLVDRSKHAFHMRPLPCRGTGCALPARKQDRSK